MTSPPALLLIDAQVNQFDPAHSVADGDALLDRFTQLVARFRAAKAPVVFVRNCGESYDPDVKGTPGWELHPALQPAAEELVLDKTTCDTFASTSLDDELNRRGITHVVIAGVQSEWCIRETTLGAMARNYEVTLVSDGHSTCDGNGRSAHEKTAAVNAVMHGRVQLLRAEEIHF